MLDYARLPLMRRRMLWLVAVLALLLAAPVSQATAKAHAALAYRSCKPVVNPYDGTRYEGVDLRRIRAYAVSCTTARRVARRAHYKAIGLPVPSSGIRRFHWDGWIVTGDIRGASDRYLATKGRARVRWLF